MIIIGIAGGTGSGKTTVVNKIVEALPEGSVAVIPQDSYYNDQSNLPLEVRKQTNFDHPNAFDAPSSNPPIRISPAHASVRPFTSSPRTLSSSRAS